MLRIKPLLLSNQLAQNNSMNAHKLIRLRQLSKLMDSQFSGPFGFKFGLDGLLGLIPVVGDIFTTFVSLYILAQGAQAGCNLATLLRMTVNIMLDSVLGVVPVLGNLVDFVWRSNDRNITLIEQQMNHPAQTARQSNWLVFIVIALIVSVVCLTAYFTVQLLRVIIVYLQTFNIHA